MILDIIVKETLERVKRDKEQFTLSDMRRKAEMVVGKESFAFEKALIGEGLHFICEVKKASPSKGIIAENFPYLKIAKEYEEAGATCISVLTEPGFFLGNDRYLSEIAKETHVPLLRKDFTVDEYQIYQGKVIGADCVLLIVAILSYEELKRYIAICDLLSLSALVEVHSEEEISIALAAGARIIGINNRNLKNFKVNINNCLRLRSFIPREVLTIAESGIQSREDIIKIESAGIHGVLVGETLMRCKDKKQRIAELRG